MSAVVSGVEVESVEYHPDTAAARTLFDPEETPASTAVIATLAEVMGADPVELDPLYSTVDPDALDALVRTHDGTTGDIHVTFTHEDHTIIAYGYGEVAITPRHEPPAETTRGIRGDDV